MRKPVSSGARGEVGKRLAPTGYAPNGTAATVEGPLDPGGSVKPAGCGFSGTRAAAAGALAGSAWKKSLASLASNAGAGKSVGKSGEDCEPGSSLGVIAGAYR
jgi:hypothetical protein